MTSPNDTYKSLGIDVEAYGPQLTELARDGKAPLRAFARPFYFMNHSDRRRLGKAIAETMRCLGFSRQIGQEPIVHFDGTRSHVTIFA